MKSSIQSRMGKCKPIDKNVIKTFLSAFSKDAWRYATPNNQIKISYSLTSRFSISNYLFSVHSLSTITTPLDINWRPYIPNLWNSSAQFHQLKRGPFYQTPSSMLLWSLTPTGTGDEAGSPQGRPPTARGKNGLSCQTHTDSAVPKGTDGSSRMASDGRLDSSNLAHRAWK